MNRDLAPIILFVYNRPWHTRQTLEALKLNELAKDSRLFIFSDGIKENSTKQEINKVKEVRSLIKEKKWCGEVKIIERRGNLGLANSIIDGVTRIVNEFGKIIVLEDDIKTEPLFITYMNIALEFFNDRKEVFHINGFNNESNLQFLLKEFYFLKFMSCWGWATWKDRWEKLLTNHKEIYRKLKREPEILPKFNYENTLNFHKQLIDNINGEINTWAILWFSTVFLNNGLCLTPKFSLVENIGMDGSGVHCGKTNLHRKKFKNKNSRFIKSFRRIAYKELALHRFHLKMYYKYGRYFSINKFVKLLHFKRLKRFYYRKT